MTDKQIVAINNPCEKAEQCCNQRYRESVPNLCGQTARSCWPSRINSKPSESLTSRRN